MLKEEKCPYCSASLEYDENNFSEEVECKYCHTKTTVIQVGEYVRTNQGYIAKLEDIDKEFMYFDNVIMCYYEETKLLPINVEMLDGIFLKAEDYVVKHSFNIIDLIEEGDYVNGIRVEDVYRPEGTYVKYIVINENHLIGSNDDIKSIVTKEQFKAMEYEVK